MKLIHLISGGDVGGAKTHVLSLLSGLNKTNTVLLVCFTEGVFAQEARELGIPLLVMQGSLHKNYQTLRKLIAERGFELIHCHGSRGNLYGSLLSGTGIPVVTTVHSDYRLDYMGRPFAALTYGLANKLALRRLDAWFGVADATVDMLISRGFDAQRVFPIYNGVSFALPPVAQSREAFLQGLGVQMQPDSVVFGIAARISPVKDMQTLILAFSEAVRQHPSARLVIAGDGEQRSAIQALAAQTCPAGTVCFAGWLEDTDSFYNALDVNVLTSLSETFPYALTEGARRHCATISSRVGGVPKLIDDGINGFLFPPRDASALAAHMCRLIDDPALRRTMAERLFDKTKREFSVEATVRRQEELYRTVLRRAARNPEHKRDGIIICGAYGRGNGGDDAILLSIVSQLRALDPDVPICVISRNPTQTKLENRTDSVYIFNLPRISKLMRRTKLYLSGGGSLIQDATSSRSLWYYLRSIRSAKRHGNKVMMFGCGIGPVQRSGNRARASKYISRYVDRITLRDSLSAQELERLGVTQVPVRVTADMAFLMQPVGEGEQQAYAYQCGLREDGKYLLLAPRPWQGMNAHLQDFADAAVYAAQTYGVTPVLYAMEPGRDAQTCKQIAERLSQQHCPYLLLQAPADARLIVGLIGRMQAVISMRLHALILAAAQGVPFAGVSYDPKVSGFVEDAGSGNVCTLADADAKTLCAMVDTVLRSARSDAAAERLRALAGENCRIAGELYRQ